MSFLKPASAAFKRSKSGRSWTERNREKGSMANSEFSSTTMMTVPEPAVAALGRSGSASLLTGKKRRRGGRAAALTSALVAMMAVIALMIALIAFSTPASGATGDSFSFAQVSDPDSGTSAPAFPGENAWWAGVCDLRDGFAATTATPPADRRFPGCIHHPALSSAGNALFPPLAPGIAPNTISDPTGVHSSGPDGWIDGGAYPGVPPQLPVGGPDWRLQDVTQAGAHPDGSASFWLSRAPDKTAGQNAQGTGPDGSPRTVKVSLPPGVVGNPVALPKCPSELLRTVPTQCPPKTQVGVSTIMTEGRTGVYPVYNVEPRDGKTAEFVISGPGIDNLAANVPIVATARTDGDFGIDAMAVEIPAGFALTSQTFTFWGVPWASSHDRYRPVASYCGRGTDTTVTPFERTPGMAITGLPGGIILCSQEPQSYDPSWGPIKPFLSTQTSCSDPSPSTDVFAANWHTNVTATEESVAPQPTGCDDLQFDPTFELEPSSKVADSPSGLSVELKVPQNNDPPASVRFDPDDEDGAPAYWESTDGLAMSHLRNSVVTLPEGVSVNPSGASGLQACDDARIGVRDGNANPPLFNNGDPLDGDDSDGVECPSASVIGTAEVSTPLLDEKLTGEVVLGAPKSTDPLSGRMFRMFLVVRNRQRGLLVKVYGSAVADPATGRLTATFENNPQVPFHDLRLKLKPGARGLLATPPDCNTEPDQYESVSSFTPWSQAHLAEGDKTPTVIEQSWTVDGNCAYGFNPGLKAGMSNAGAREGGTFGFEFTRPQGDQTLKGLTAELPTGLLATVKDLPLCKDAQAAAGNCPAASRIGLVDASAGSGDPFVLEQKGEIFLTEGYKGGAYGLMVKVRAIAGPFRGAMELSPIVVRQKIEVDPTTAQVKAISDPFPTVHHGVPLRVRRVLVSVDRPGFMVNPSDCSGKQVKAALTSIEGTVAERSNPFQVSGCRGLAFKPKLALRLTGRKQVRTGKHPGIRAVVTQKGVSEAGIKKAEVRLPKSLALDVNNAGALCEFVDGTKPDLEKHCPKGSIVGRARATSPLLDRPLAGNVYFVKNVRRDPKTGNEIRTLPMVIAALRGEIAINLRGESSVDKRNRLVSTFATVPDAPVSKFNMNIKGGKRGIIAVTRTRRALINLCARPKSHIAESDMDGHNGRRHDNDIRMKTPCSKKQTKQAKRAAKKAARKARNARR
jgi:hypothetical protein